MADRTRDQVTADLLPATRGQLAGDLLDQHRLLPALLPQRLGLIGERFGRVKRAELDHDLGLLLLPPAVAAIADIAADTTATPRLT